MRNLIRQIVATHSDMVAFFAISVAVLSLFGDVLFSSDRVLSSGDTDVFLTFYHQRHFAATEMRAGNFPHWNPYIYSGSTFALDSEPALCYPLHVHYLFLPTHRAINVDIALHFILLGFFFYLWVSRQGVPLVAALMGSAVVMCGGAYYLHFFAGHLGVLATSAWVPLVLYAIDRFVADRSRWVTAGSMGAFAAAMSLLAGQMQYAIIGASAAGAYALLLMVLRRRTVHFLPLCFFMGIYVVSLLLAAVAVLPAYDGMSTSYRTAVSDTFLASFSFHPENLISLIAPTFFGGDHAVMYWGKEYHWEESFFIGTGALLLAGLGLHGRLQKGVLVAVLFFLVLALGAHTPLFEVTKRLPIFDKMRGQGKFIFAATLFIACLAAHGAAEILRRVPARAVAVTTAVALLLGVAAYLIGNTYALEEWREFMMRVALADTRFAFYGNLQNFDDPAFILRAQSASAVALYHAAGKFLLLAVILATSRWWRHAAYLVLLVSVAELLAFAQDFRRDFPVSRLVSAELKELHTRLSSADRTLDLTVPNRAMTVRVPTVTGYNSRILPERYYALLPFLQRRDLWESNENGEFSHRYRFSSLLRVKSIITDAKVLPVSDPPFPQAFLVDRYRVVSREEAVENMVGLGDDLDEVALLEQDPPVHPRPGAPATVQVKDLSTDERIIEVTIDTPRVLVLTDSYDPRWEAFPQQGSAQDSYEILPADLVLAAIPLREGSHRILLRYFPVSWRVGITISLGGWLLFGAVVIWFMVTRKREAHA